MRIVRLGVACRARSILKALPYQGSASARNAKTSGGSHSLRKKRRSSVNVSSTRRSVAARIPRPSIRGAHLWIYALPRWRDPCMEEFTWTGDVNSKNIWLTLHLYTPPNSTCSFVKSSSAFINIDGVSMYVSHYVPNCQLLIPRIGSGANSWTFAAECSI